jgi:hypothetical protein
MSQSQFSEFYFPLNEWVKGTDLIADIHTNISERAETFSYLLKLKQQGLLLQKPTLSTNQTFTFWVNDSLHDTLSTLPGLYGGHKIVHNQEKLPLEGINIKKNTRPRLVLVDVNIDSKELTDELKCFQVESKRIWDYVSDIIQYELIEVCTTQYVDLIITTNDRLLTRSEEWLKYLLPHRTRLCIITKELLADPKKLAFSINQRAWMKKSRSKKTSEKKPLILDKNEERTQ